MLKRVAAGDKTFYAAWPKLPNSHIFSPTSVVNMTYRPGLHLWPKLFSHDVPRRLSVNYPDLKKLHHLVLPLLMVCAVASADPDAPPGPPGGRGWGPPDPQQHVARLTEELGLNEDQAAELLEIFTAADAEREALRAQHEADMCALHNGVDDQVRSVLTSSQQAELDDLRAEFKARHEERMENHDGPHKGSWRGKHRGGFPDCDSLDGDTEAKAETATDSKN